MNEKRSFYACLVDKEKNSIHVIGGSGDNGHLKSTEKWTFHKDLWVSGESFPEAIWASAAVSANSNDILAFLVAGATANGDTPKLWYLRRNMSWIEDGSRRIKTPRAYHTVVNMPGDQIPGC